MNMNNVTERVARCFSGVFPDLRREELARASTASLAGWDSIAQVTLLSSIAEEFDLEFELEDFDDLVSYALIVDYLERKSIDG
jgi:acyl carrier protein